MHQEVTRPEKKLIVFWGEKEGGATGHCRPHTCRFSGQFSQVSKVLYVAPVKAVSTLAAQCCTKHKHSDQLCLDRWRKVVEFLGLLCQWSCKVAEIYFFSLCPECNQSGFNYQVR